MPKSYIKKRVIIEAVQFTGDNYKEIEDFVGRPLYISYGMMAIPTLEGIVRCKPGNYVIKGVKGEFYPCDKEIFELTYEEV